MEETLWKAKDTIMNNLENVLQLMKPTLWLNVQRNNQDFKCSVNHSVSEVLYNRLCEVLED